MPDEGWGDETVRGAQVVTTPEQQSLRLLGQILDELRELREMLTRASGIEMPPEDKPKRSEPYGSGLKALIRDSGTL